MLREPVVRGARQAREELRSLKEAEETMLTSASEPGLSARHMYGRAEQDIYV